MSGVWNIRNAHKTATLISFHTGQGSEASRIQTFFVEICAVIFQNIVSQPSSGTYGPQDLLSIDPLDSVLLRYDSNSFQNILLRIVTRFLIIWFLFRMYLWAKPFLSTTSNCIWQGRRKVWKSEGARSTVVGIICLPGWDRVKCLVKKVTPKGHFKINWPLPAQGRRKVWKSGGGS